MSKSGWVWGINPNIPVPYLDRPTSRFKRLPVKAQRVAAKNQHFQENANILLYLKNVPAGRVTEIRNNLRNFVTGSQSSAGDDNNLVIEPGVIGVEYDRDPNDPFGRIRRPIYGNDAGRELLTEYDEATDRLKEAPISTPARSEEEQNIRDLYQDAFGPHFISGMSLVKLTELSLFWVRFRLKVRLREFNNYVFNDFNAGIPNSQTRRYRDIHFSVNQLVHKAVLAEDILWARFPHVDPDETIFKSTKALTEAHFEAIYRLRVDEATAIVYWAISVQRYPNGSPMLDWMDKPIRTYPGELCSWLVQVICKFVEWRYWVVGLLKRRRLNAASWRQRGGVMIDNLYEQTLQDFFPILRCFQTDAQVSDAQQRSFEKSVHYLFAVIKQRSWTLITKSDWDYLGRGDKSDSDRDTMRFPETMPTSYRHSTRVVFPPGVELYDIPLAMPRQALVLNRRYIEPLYTPSRVLIPADYDGGDLKPMGFIYSKIDGKGPFSGLARVVRSAGDSQLSDDEDDEEESQFYDVDSERGWTPHGRLDGGPHGREKRVSFATPEPRGDKSSPSELSSGHSLKRRASHDTYGSSPAKKLRSGAVY
ncbi:hypothetical protein F4781DRAFT_404923 [Annulohypoxylon bovei var. microspora]|nr:hypothetical protein F4781DRAFT_404923 [Annulohypoxylon bovei var. microspora]